jgi:hypothetical protein
MIESATASGMVASILILDEGSAAPPPRRGPSLPDADNEAIDGLEIGAEVGSCGTAAYHDKTVSVFDIANSPLWAASGVATVMAVIIRAYQSEIDDGVARCRNAGVVLGHANSNRRG